MNRVIAVSRNCAFIRTSDNRHLEITLKASNRTAVVGDYCKLSENENSFSLLPRNNLFSRSYRNRTKNLAANVDHLFIVTAIKPGIHTLFIDRTLSSCKYENISASILLNKSDLDYTSASDSINQYQRINIDVHTSCTKSDTGCDDLIKFIKVNKFSTVAFCGISGVGKSSIINKLAPHALSRVGQLSDKGDVGKQTTSMARLFRTENNDLEVSVIDLPGLQHFGISNIPLESLANTFIEFISPGDQCRFNDCTHTNEPDCVVLLKLESGRITQSRYRSYLDMRSEIISSMPSYGKPI